MIKKMFFGSSKIYEPNTFIGGVGGSYITSSSDYLPMTTLLESEIKNFQIDANNNVSFYVTKEYSLENLALFNNSSIKYFIDAEGKVNTAGSSFLSMDVNLKHVFLPQTIIVRAQTFRNSLITKLNVESFTDLSDRMFQSIRVNKLYMKGLRSMSSERGEICTNLLYLERAYLANLDSISTAVRNATIIQNPVSGCFLINVKSSAKIYYNSALGVENRNSYATMNCGFNVGDTININGLNYTAVAGYTTTIGEFQADVIPNTQGVNLKNSINSDTRIGDYSKVSSINNNAYIGFIVDAIGILGDSVNITLGTGNTGNTDIIKSFSGGNDLHPCLLYLKDRGCTMIECNTPISVNAPTALSYSDITSNSVKLNFTTPIANANGNDGYEVWVEDATLYRKLFEYEEVTASGQVLDLAEVVTDLGTIIGVKIKIRTIDGQMNFSPFSNEITLP